MSQGHWPLVLFDARVAVVFGAASDAGVGDVVLSDGLVAAGHPAGCACCTSRAAAAEALGRLFLQRARGEVAFFRRVIIDTDDTGVAAVKAALQSDPVVSARFRYAERGLSSSADQRSVQRDLGVQKL